MLPGTRELKNKPILKAFRKYCHTYLWFMSKCLLPCPLSMKRSIHWFKEDVFSYFSVPNFNCQQRTKPFQALTLLQLLLNGFDMHETSFNGCSFVYSRNLRVTFYPKIRHFSTRASLTYQILEYYFI